MKKIHWRETEEEEAMYAYIERLEDCIGSLSNEFFDIKDNGDYYSGNSTHYENLAQLVNRTLDSRPTLNAVDSPLLCKCLGDADENGICQQCGAAKPANH